MVLCHDVQHLTLRVIHSPAPHALGQCGGRYPGFHPETAFQRMEGAGASLQRFIEVTPYLHCANQRCPCATIRAPSTIEPSLPPQARRRLGGVCGLYVIHYPSHNASANLTQQGVEFPCKICHLLWRRLLVLEELLKQFDAMGEQAGE